MLLNRPYLPEGLNKSYQNNAAQFSLSESPEYIRDRLPLEMTVVRCDSAHNLHGSLNGLHAVIRRADAIFPAVSGADKEIAVLSLVGKNVCCVLTGVETGENQEPLLILSRSLIQEQALEYLRAELHEGDVIPAVITSMSQIGVFADIGCGVIALLPIRQISVSRIHHPQERFAPCQQIYAVVEKIEWNTNRFLLSHKELLGTWRENAAAFQEGETVTGIVRGVKSYGVFIELAPNLTGLAEPDDTLQDGDRVTVLLKAILPEKHKIKLHVVGKLPGTVASSTLQYHIRSKNITDWIYWDS